MMRTPLCAACELKGFCQRLTSMVVTRDELTPPFIADVRELMRACDLSRDAWVPYLIGGYRDYPGRILHPSGAELHLNTHLLTGKAVRYYYRDLCEPIPEGVTPRVRIEARGRFLVLATILRALHPISAITWGKGDAPVPEAKIRPVQPSSTDACWYRHFTITGW